MWKYSAAGTGLVLKVWCVTFPVPLAYGALLELQGFSDLYFDENKDTRARLAQDGWKGKWLYQQYVLSVHYVKTGIQVFQ